MNRIIKDTVTLELTNEEMNLLNLLLGIGTGTLSKEDNKIPAWCIRLVNKVNENNPNFIPYGIDT